MMSLCGSFGSVTPSHAAQCRNDAQHPVRALSLQRVATAARRNRMQRVVARAQHSVHALFQIYYFLDTVGHVHTSGSVGALFIVSPAILSRVEARDTFAAFLPPLLALHCLIRTQIRSLQFYDALNNGGNAFNLRATLSDKTFDCCTAQMSYKSSTRKTRQVFFN